jgi:hypothetical protein
MIGVTLFTLDKDSNYEVQSSAIFPRNQTQRVYLSSIPYLMIFVFLKTECGHVTEASHTQHLGI